MTYHGAPTTFTAGVLVFPDGRRVYECPLTRRYESGEPVNWDGAAFVVTEVAAGPHPVYGFDDIRDDIRRLHMVVTLDWKSTTRTVA